MKSTFLAVSALLAATAAAQTSVTFVDFGRPCGGDLSGALVRTPAGAAIQLNVTGAASNALAVLVIGSMATTPHALPGSNCLLLVEPRATHIDSTDARGNARFQLRLPPIVPLVVDFQVATAELSRQGRVVESTDGVELRVR